jgi:hypothetical protein
MIPMTQYDFGRALRTRQNKRPRSTLPVTREVDGQIERAKVPIEDHFAALVMFSFPPPGLLLGFPPTETFVGTIVTASLHPDPGRRARKTGKVNIIRRGGFDARVFGLMLAKIAHSFAVAKLGIGGFQPLLQDMIRGFGPPYLGLYIGCSLDQESNSIYRHDLRLEEYNSVDGVDLLVARIRLFGDRGMPTYHVVVGTPNPPPTPP